ncbi:MAG: DUF433 domain-containing protein [Blastocatellia bacterium]
MQSVITNHIHLDEEGRAWIDGANTKVIEVVLDKLACDWSVEEIHEQHPHLSLAQIHAALSYYYDHQSEIDAEIERQDKEIDALMENAKDSPLKNRLRSLPRKLDQGTQAIIDQELSVNLDKIERMRPDLSRKQIREMALDLGAEELVFRGGIGRRKTEEQVKRRA